ncbi:MAG: hypothetical protein ACE5GB_15555 [Acidimicrobiales bacterium]
MMRRLAADLVLMLVVTACSGSVDDPDQGAAGSESVPAAADVEARDDQMQEPAAAPDDSDPDPGRSDSDGDDGASGAIGEPTLAGASPVRAVDCAEVGVELLRRRESGALGELERPRDDGEVDPVIEYVVVDDSVAAAGERPIFDEFPPLADVDVVSIADRDLVSLAHHC